MDNDEYNFYEILMDHFNGSVYKTYADYLEALNAYIADMAEALQKANSWAREKDPEVLKQLGVEIEELDDEEF